MSRALEFLRATQNADGGWGYRVGGMSFVEPTAAAVLVLRADSASADKLQRARAWLQSLQHPDGGWGIAALDETSGWMTAWAIWALADSGVDLRNALGWLLKSAGLRVTDPSQIQGVEQVLHIDPTITGWGWQPGDAGWIFPTALALLALDAAGVRNHPRIQEATKYLLDRGIATGGWNIGNPFMVTGNMPPTVENTALALLALDTLDIQSDTITLAKAWLAQTTFTKTSFEWAWRAWYWKRVGQSDNGAIQALAGLARADGSFDGNPFTTAIALMGGAE